MAIYQKLKSTCLVSSAILFSINANALVIDDFETAQGSLTSSSVGGGAASQAGVAAGIMGGSRDMLVEKLDGTSSLSAEVKPLGSPVNEGALEVNIDSFTSGFLALTYDGSNVVGVDWDSELDIANTGVGVDTDGLGGIDFTEGGINTDFVFSTWFVDQNNPFTVNIWTENSGNYQLTSVDFLTEGKPASPTAEDRFISFSQFSSLGADLEDVGAIQFIFNLDNSLGSSQYSADLTVGLASAIPEPSIVALFGGGMLLAGFAGKRRRKLGI